MPSLHQIIALTNGRKSRAKHVSTEAYTKLQKRDLLSGITRTYEPKTEDGERLPPEAKGVQYTVSQAITNASQAWSELFDTVAAQDKTNTLAKADIVVEGQTLVKDVPVTHLLFLEHQLGELSTFVDAMPTLDPAYTWQYDTTIDVYRSPETKTLRTNKVLKNHVKYPHTEKHPAQVEVFTMDEPVGEWTKVEFSGAVPATEKAALAGRVRKLQEAVKLAREQANTAEVVDLKTGTPLLNYVFGN